MRAYRAKWVASVLGHAVWPRRGYVDLPPNASARVRAYAAGWASVPASIRAMPDLPSDTGAGHILRWEHRWVLRPAAGWRSWRWLPPTHVNKQLGPEQRDAAADWALEILGIS